MRDLSSNSLYISLPFFCNSLEETQQQCSGSQPSAIRPLLNISSAPYALRAPSRQWFWKFSLSYPWIILYIQWIIWSLLHLQCSKMLRFIPASSLHVRYDCISFVKHENVVTWMSHISQSFHFHASNLKHSSFFTALHVVATPLLRPSKTLHLNSPWLSVSLKSV